MARHVTELWPMEHKPMIWALQVGPETPPRHDSPFLLTMCPLNEKIQVLEEGIATGAGSLSLSPHVGGLLATKDNFLFLR